MLSVSHRRAPARAIECSTNLHGALRRDLYSDEDMGLIAPDIFDVEPPESPDEVMRRAFRAGVKAAFLVSQFNRLGQILCSRCGRSWSDLAGAFDGLELEPVVDEGDGYRGGAELGRDHPNNLTVTCWHCRT